MADNDTSREIIWDYGTDNDFYTGTLRLGKYTLCKQLESEDHLEICLQKDVASIFWSGKQENTEKFNSDVENSLNSRIFQRS